MKRSFKNFTRKKFFKLFLFFNSESPVNYFVNFFFQSYLTFGLQPNSRSISHGPRDLLEFFKGHSLKDLNLFLSQRVRSFWGCLSWRSYPNSFFRKNKENSHQGRSSLSPHFIFPRLQLNFHQEVSLIINNLPQFFILQWWSPIQLFPSRFFWQ